jgi:hypothetical protein
MLPDQKYSITKKFIEVATKHNARCYHSRRDLTFLSHIKHDSELWLDMLDVLDQVPDNSFIATVSHDPGNLKLCSRPDGTLFVPSDRQNWAFPCETCYRAYLQSVSHCACRAGVLMRPREATTSLGYGKVCKPGSAFRLLTEFISNPTKPACTSDDCTTPAILDSNKYIATLWGGNAVMSFKVSFSTR